MNGDNLYPRDGDQMSGPFGLTGLPEERLLSQEQQDAPLNRSLPILDELIDWFEDCILDCDSIDNIQVQSLTINGVKYSRDVAVQAQVLAMQLMKQKYTEKQDEFIKFAEKKR